jgi:hypothetical protein
LSGLVKLRKKENRKAVVRLPLFLNSAGRQNYGSRQVSLCAVSICLFYNCHRFSGGSPLQQNVAKQEIPKVSMKVTGEIPEDEVEGPITVLC